MLHRRRRAGALALVVVLAIVGVLAYSLSSGGSSSSTSATSSTTTTTSAAPTHAAGGSGKAVVLTKGPQSLEAGVAEEMAALLARSAALSHPRSPAAKFVKLGVRMLVLRRMVTRTEAGLLVNPDERVLVAYYANSIAHLFEG